MTISERLKAFGLIHQPGDNGRRYLSGPTGPLGLMSAEEAANLLALLEDDCVGLNQIKAALQKDLEKLPA